MNNEKLLQATLDRVERELGRLRVQYDVVKAAYDTANEERGRFKAEAAESGSTVARLSARVDELEALIMKDDG